MGTPSTDAKDRRWQFFLKYRGGRDSKHYPMGCEEFDDFLDNMKWYTDCLDDKIGKQILWLVVDTEGMRYFSGYSFKNKAGNPRVVFNRDIPGELPWVQGNSISLKQFVEQAESTMRAWGGEF